MSGHGNQDSDYFNNPAGEQLPALAQWVEPVREALTLGLAHAHQSAKSAHFEGGQKQYSEDARKIEAALRVLPSLRVQPLSDEQIDKISARYDVYAESQNYGNEIHHFARAIESHLSAPLAERPQGATEPKDQP